MNPGAMGPLKLGGYWIPTAKQLAQQAEQVDGELKSSLRCNSIVWGASPHNTHTALHICPGQGFRGFMSSRKRSPGTCTRPNPRGCGRPQGWGRGRWKDAGEQSHSSRSAGAKLGEAAGRGGFPGLHGNVMGSQGEREAGGERPLCIDLSPVRFNPERKWIFLMRLLAALKMQIKFRRNRASIRK